MTDSPPLESRKRQERKVLNIFTEEAKDSSTKAVDEIPKEEGVSLVSRGIPFNLITNDSEDFESSTPTSIDSSQPSMMPTEPPSDVPTSLPTASANKIYSSEPSMSPKQRATLLPSEVSLQIPIPSYYLTLVLEESMRRRTGERWGRLLALNQSMLEGLVAELDIVLVDYMIHGLGGKKSVAELAGMNIMVFPDEGSSQHRQLRGRKSEYNIMLDGPRKWERFLLQEVESPIFFVNGSAIFVDAGNDRADEEDLSTEVDAAVKSLLHASNNEDFLNFIQTHPESRILRNTVGVNVSIERGGSDGDRPSIVAVVFGCLLILVGLATLCCSIFIWWTNQENCVARTKQKKNASQPQGSVEDVPVSPRKSVPSYGISRAASARSVAPGIVPANRHDHSVPSASIQMFWAEECLSEDDIAKKLQLAASFDRKVCEGDQHSQPVRFICL